jgi:hypothetical protein
VFLRDDMVQTRFGHGAIVAMLAALVLSYITSDRPSPWPVPAFAVSECIDWLVFSITKRPLRPPVDQFGAEHSPRYLHLFRHDRRAPLP